MLAYVKEGDLCMKPLPDGQAQRLTTGGHCANPRWSPSGQWVAYVKDDELWLVRASGTDARALNPSAKVNTFMWSPAADMLAYTTRTGSLCVVSASDW